MSLLLPVSCYFLLYRITIARRSNWREAIIRSAILFALLLVILTESLSVFDQFNFLGLTLGWLIVDAILIVVSLRCSAGDALRSTPVIPPTLKILLGGVLLVVVLTGITALVAPPNSWDSMTYHMARVAHWVQNQSVHHYPTGIQRQLYQPPFAEFVLAHLQILTGSDQFANLLQWFMMVGSLIGVSLIARLLGADTRGQVFAVVVCATLPMGILQASSTQNDYVFSFWLVCLVSYVLLSMKENRCSFHILGIGASMGLLMLTKGTAPLFIAPLVLGWGLTLPWRRWRQLVLAGVIALLIMSGHFARNLAVYGSPLIPREESSVVVNEIFTVPVLVSNLARNVSLHLFAAPEWIERILPVNRVINGSLNRLHRWLNADIQDRRTTFLSAPFIMYPLNTDEEYSGNPLHLILLVGCIWIYALSGSMRRPDATFLLISSCLSFVLLGLLLKWQPFHSRLHLGLFVVLSAFTGLTLSSMKHRNIAMGIALVLLIGACPWIFMNQMRPWLAERNIFNMPRLEQYFVERPSIMAHYTEAAAIVRATQCESVGLYLSADSWDYPLYVLLHDDTSQVRLQHIAGLVFYPGLSAQANFRNFVPCAIITAETEKPETFTYQNRVFTRVWDEGDVSVMLPRLQLRPTLIYNGGILAYYEP